VADLGRVRADRCAAGVVAGALAVVADHLHPAQRAHRAARRRRPGAGPGRPDRVGADGRTASSRWTLRLPPGRTLRQTYWPTETKWITTHDNNNNYQYDHHPQIHKGRL